MEIYFIIGLVYTLINTQIRKIEPEDPLLVLVWICLWPMALIVLFIHYLENKYKKHEL
jgi:hypothetical protein